MIQIEKNIPIPASASATRSRAMYPFAGMAVGESIFVQGDTKVQHNAVLSTRRFMASNKGTLFVFGNTGDGVRIWRKE